MKAVSLRSEAAFSRIFLSPKVQSTFASEKISDYEIRRNNI